MHEIVSNVELEAGVEILYVDVDLLDGVDDPLRDGVDREEDRADFRVEMSSSIGLSSGLFFGSSRPNAEDNVRPILVRIRCNFWASQYQMFPTKDRLLNFEVYSWCCWIIMEPD